MEAATMREAGYTRPGNGLSLKREEAEQWAL